MRIGIFGCGYVGLVQAAVFADVGHTVCCVDVDAARIEKLSMGEVPFYEPNLSQLIQTGIDNGLLGFSTDTAKAVLENDYLFICVGTPPKADGGADLSQVMSVADTIATHMQERKVVITKSTVPVGTTEKVKLRITQKLADMGRELVIDAASNPEFLKEGSAVSDCQSPDRIIIGTDNPQVTEELRRMYRAFNRNHEKIMAVDTRSAELTKYAANALLATKISFMNEIANIAETVGADIEYVRRGIGSDPRIGYQFIYPGAGYGGSCFPKDVQALKHLATENSSNADILQAVHDTNQRQKGKLAEKLVGRLGNDLTGKTIAVWGLSFKPNTDDMREAPSLDVMEGIWEKGGRVQAHDPQANDACARIYGDRNDLELYPDKDLALTGADALIICTEWKAFWSPDFSKVKSLLNQALIFDGRNLYDPEHMESLDIEYYAIGRGRTLPDTG